MTRQELIIALNLVLDQGEQLSTVVYAVMKDTTEIKQLDIVNDEIDYIQNMFINSIKSAIIDVDEQTLVKVSEADDRSNTVFEYDLELPESLNYFEIVLDDNIPIFSFINDDLGNINSLIIEIGTEEFQLKLLKQLSSVEVFGRGGYMLWKSNQQLERFEDKVLRLTPKFNAITISGTTVFTELKFLESSHGFHNVIIKEANNSILIIQNLDILDTTDGIKELLSNISFARKVLKIKNSPVIRNNIPNSVIINFTKTHPALLKKMKYNEDNTKIILKTKLSKELFIKMLDDAYLTSELTSQFYESKAKDEVVAEIEEVE
jgi:hypothetical protein